MAQGMVSEIKIVAVQKTDSLAPQAEGYSGANDFDLDFRKGRGGGYVFAIFKKPESIHHRRESGEERPLWCGV